MVNLRGWADSDELDTLQSKISNLRFELMNKDKEKRAAVDPEIPQRIQQVQMRLNSFMQEVNAELESIINELDT